MRLSSWASAGPVRRRRPAWVLLGSLLAVAGCSTAVTAPVSTPPATEVVPVLASPSPSPSPSPSATGLAGMPPVLDSDDVWAADRPGRMSPVVKGMPARIYVPNSGSNTVTVIDPKTYKVLRTVNVGRQPQHVVPSWDLKTLWVNNDLGDSLTPINPRTGHFGTPVPVSDPYNLYFTPNGRSAVVMASADQQIVFRDPHTMAIQKKVPAHCDGVNHADFSADGRYFLVSCEFDGQLLKVDTARRKIVARMQLPDPMAKPQDVKMSGDGKVFYVADMMMNGLWLIDAVKMKVVDFIETGKGAHGLYVTRDSKNLLITNRDEGSVSVLKLATRKLVAKWRIPGGGSPDMGGISADGKVFWVAGRYNSEVYAISTRDGHLIKRIKVGSQPHGLSVYPQPGRYSMGHTGIFR